MRITTTSRTSAYTQRLLTQSQQPAATPQVSTERRAEVSKQLQVDVTRLRRELASLDKLASRQVSAATAAAGPIVAEAAGVTLDPVPYSVYESGGEMNASPSSYTPYEPTWWGASTAAITVGGTYQGADDALAFEVSAEGAVGSGTPRLRVRDGAGTVVDEVLLDGPAGQEYALSNGLTVRLGAGNVYANDSFSVSVSASGGTAVNPDAAFDGIGSAAPHFEAGRQVVAGSFAVNGDTVEVAANDTINTVLAKINALGTGLTGAYDAQREQIVFTQNAPGPIKTLDFSGDTSGFLAATKLNAAHHEVRHAAPLDTPIDQVTGISAISSGHLRINGTTIAIDTSVDSLNDVIQRINGSGAGVSATFDSVTGKLRLTATAGDVMTLEDGTSGFFSRMGMADSEFRATQAAVGGMRRRQAEDLADAMKDVDKLLTSVLRQMDELGSTTGQGYRQNLTKALDGLLSGSNTIKRTKFGFKLDTVAAEGDLIDVSRGRFVQALQSKPSDVLKFLRGDGSSDSKGFVATLDTALKAIEASLERQNGTQALLVNGYI